LVTEHEQMNQQMLVPNLAQSYQPYHEAVAQVQQALFNNGMAMADAVMQAPRQLYQTLQLQSAVLAYIDVFFITGLLSLVLVPAALFMTGIKTDSDG
jgi:DHA2 family multidrug resistance protein